MAFDPTLLSQLAQVLDTSFGRSSTPLTNTFSVKFAFAGPNQIVAKYGSMVYFASHTDFILMRRKYEAESRDMIDQVLSAAKKDFKELTGKTLKVVETHSESTMDFNGIGNNKNLSRQYSVFRRNTIFELG